MEALGVYTPAQIKEIESIAINKFEIPETVLMEHAALSVFNFINKNFSKERRIILICGPGKNGGDALALGRILYSNHWDIKIFHSKSSFLPQLTKIEEIQKDDVVVDGLFGTGLNREIGGEFYKTIEYINRLNPTVISLDIPSGVSALNGGIVGGIAVKSDFTITFCWEKIGLYNYPGSNYCGEIIPTRINIPLEVFSNIDTRTYINDSPKFPGRKRNAYKTSYGRVLIISGSENYYGAPYFATKASVISGSGYTTLLSNPRVIDSIAPKVPEAIFKTSESLLNELLSNDFILYGPGIGSNYKMLEQILKSTPKSLLIDGDGLGEILLNKELFFNYKGDKIITPHPGEAAKLLGRSVEDINSNRVESARELTRIYNTNAVLKGEYSVISFLSGNCYINKRGSQTLATAGSGDILSGVIAGLVGYLGVNEGVKSGVFIHSLMGEIAEKKYGSTALSASELLSSLREATLPSQL